MTKTAILLAAGTGSRLGTITADKPKALVEVARRPLISYALDFAKAAGAERTVVVGGYCHDALERVVRTHHEDTQVVENTEYRKGNIFSLMRAIGEVQGPFLLMNVDHIYSTAIADKVRGAWNGGIVACCDVDRTLGLDDMKVWAENGRLIEISKQLHIWNAGYVGMTLCDAAHFALYESYAQRVAASNPDRGVVEEVIALLAREGYPVRIHDISGHGWCEVDFPHELEAAEHTVRAYPTKFFVTPPPPFEEKRPASVSFVQRALSGNTPPPRFEIAPAEGKLGVLLVGLGACATTFVAGIEAIRRGLAKPIGSLTQMGTIRLGRRDAGRSPRISDFVPLANINDLEFFAWDAFPDNAYEAACKARVLEKEHLEPLRDALARLNPAPAVFEQQYVKNIRGTHVKTWHTKIEAAERIMDDIRRWSDSRGIKRMVMVWIASTEAYLEPGAMHGSLSAFEQGLRQNDPAISPSQVYAYAALKMGIPFINGAPNLTVDIRALQELAAQSRVPIAGKDLKTGQTLMKTILAPGLKARMLGVKGWFSANILGNRDGEVLDDPESFKTKEVSKLSVLEHILQPHLYEDLYREIHHKVRIHYYPPAGDNKEGWDNIDIFGWMGYPMQIKINFLCRDSILAAPLILDLALFADLAKRAQWHGTQEWLSFYFKSPMVKEGLYPEHDLFIQQMKLKNTLRTLMGEELITHTGLDYYDYYQ